MMLSRPLSVMSLVDKGTTTVTLEEIPISPLEFDRFYPWTCRKMGAEADIHIMKKVEEKYTRKGKKKFDLAEGEDIKNVISHTERKMSEVAWKTVDHGGRCIVPVLAVYDTRGCLTQLEVTNSDCLSQKHIKVLKICLPFHPTLSKVIMTKCKLNQEILYELGQLLEPSQIVEIILDDTLCKHGNFHAVLEVTQSLKRLSLNRCRINDSVMNELFKKVKEPLQIIELSGNFITDKGLRIVGHTLRTNRSIIHLNLAGNSITDDGAAHILDVLMKFELTHAEIQEMRKRKLNYFNRRQICFEEQKKLVGARSAAAAATKKNIKSAGKNLDKSPKKSETTVSIAIAEKKTLQLLGTFEDVFDDTHVEFDNDKIFCDGNFKLGSLNLAYNNLSHIGMTKVLRVLEYQNSSLVPSGAGLIRIVTGGNNLCETCEVKENISKYLSNKVSKMCGPTKSVKHINDDYNFARTRVSKVR